MSDQTKKPDAKADAKAKDAASTTSAGNSADGRGKAIILSNGERRIDYIHRRYCDENTTRGVILKELNDQFKQDIPYQIVFGGTRGLKQGVPYAQQAVKKPEAAATATPAVAATAKA